MQKYFQSQYSLSFQSYLLLQVSDCCVLLLALGDTFRSAQ